MVDGSIIKLLIVVYPRLQYIWNGEESCIYKRVQIIGKRKKNFFFFRIKLLVKLFASS